MNDLPFVVERKILVADLPQLLEPIGQEVLVRVPQSELFAESTPGNYAGAGTVGSYRLLLDVWIGARQTDNEFVDPTVPDDTGYGQFLRKVHGLDLDLAVLRFHNDERGSMDCQVECFLVATRLHQPLDVIVRPNPAVAA